MKRDGYRGSNVPNTNSPVVPAACKPAGGATLSHIRSFRDLAERSQLQTLAVKGS